MFFKKVYLQAHFSFIICVTGCVTSNKNNCQMHYLAKAK
jgi:hypothetical protein